MGRCWAYLPSLVVMLDMDLKDRKRELFLWFINIKFINMIKHIIIIFPLCRWIYLEITRAALSTLTNGEHTSHSDN